MKHTKKAIKDLQVAYESDLSQYINALNHDLRGLAARSAGLLDLINKMPDTEERRQLMAHLIQTNEDLLNLIAVWNKELHQISQC